MLVVRRARYFVALAAWLSCALAHGQTVPSLTIESDYRFRGVTLSRGKPSLRLGLSHDDASGWYAGASVAAVEFERSRHEQQLIGYAGFVSSAGPRRLRWELGATASRFSGRGGYDYVEGLAGVIDERWNARLYVSPDYFGLGRRSVYVEWNGGMPIDQPWPRPVRLFAHAGALRVLGRDSDGAERVRLDARFGASVAFDAFDAQLAWVGTRRGNYFATPGTSRGGWVLSASFFF